MRNFIIGLAVAVVTYAAMEYHRASPIPDRLDSRSRVIRVYDVHHLLNKRISPDEANDAHDITITPAGLFNPTGKSSWKMDTETYYGEKLSELISEAVLPESWANNGGDSDNTLKYTAGMLTVTQTPGGQAKVEEFLRLLDGGK